MPPDRLAGFPDGNRGGNPAGVHLSERLPETAGMQRIAREVSSSETAFAAPEGTGFRLRDRAPAAEVAFCGHATIALGAGLAAEAGPGHSPRSLRDATIEVEVREGDGGPSVTLVSPPTWSRPLAPGLGDRLPACVGLAEGDLDPRPPPSRAHGGVTDAVLAPKTRDRLSAMSSPSEPVRALMEEAALTTVSLLWIEHPRLFHARNAFAVGRVVEGPATGAAAAALGGLLTDLGWPLADGRFTVLQGAGMGSPSRIEVETTGVRGAPVRVTGRARSIEAR